MFAWTQSRCISRPIHLTWSQDTKQNMQTSMLVYKQFFGGHSMYTNKNQKSLFKISTQKQLKF